MLKIAICDDNNIICSEIEKNILEYNKTSSENMDIEVFTSGEDLIKFIEVEHPFDLIFLDIELGTTTGILVGQKIRNEFDDHISKIVFISSITGYEQELFDVQPLNFLKKPIDKGMLIKCIQLAIKILDKENKTFEYQTKKDIKKVCIKEIVYFESSLKKIKIVLLDKEDFFYSNFDSIKEKLPKTFISPHGSFLVNFDKIERISKQDLTMCNGKVIPVSRRNIATIQNMQIQVLREIRDANF